MPVFLLTLFLSCPHSLLEQGRSQSVSWDGFPHHLGDGARAQLYNTAFLHLQVGVYNLQMIKSTRCEMHIVPVTRGAATGQ